MNRDTRLLGWLLLGLIAHNVGAPAIGSESENPIEPKTVIRLFNGKDLSGWTSWLVDTKYEDPRNVFSVQNECIRISGDGFGYLGTDQAYRNYRLSLEVRWGGRNWGQRIGKARDSGLFLHSAGPDGGSYDRGWGAKELNDGPDISSGAWKATIECQIMEGDFGGLIILRGRYSDGKDVPVRLTTRVTRETGSEGYGPPRFDPEGELETFTEGWIRWSGTDPNWSDVYGFRGQSDVESPAGQWTRIECICDDDRITIFVNGKKVNEAYDVFPRSGKILLQCEGSEVFYRNIELRPLDSR